MPLQDVFPVVRIAERPGSGKVTFGKGGIHGERTWQVPWRDPFGRTYLDYVSRLLGSTISGPNLTPNVTFPDSFSPELPFLYCQEVEVEGEDVFGADQWGRAQYRRAILKAKYMPYEMGESFRLAAQILSFKEETYAYVGPLANPPPPPPFFLDDIIKEIELLDRRLESLLKAIINAQNGEDDDYSDIFADDELGPPPGFAPLEILNQMYEALLSKRDNLKKKRDQQKDGGGLTNQEYAAKMTAWALEVGGRIRDPGVSADYYSVNNAGQNPVQSVVGKVIPLGEYTLEKHFVLSPNFFNYIALLGCTNNDFFLGFPPWTLLFSGMDGKRVVMPSGARNWDMHFKFMFNPNGHNLLYRPEKGRWEVIVSRATSTQSFLMASSIREQLTGQVGNVFLNDAGDWDEEVHKYLYQPADFTPFLYYV